jgi:hypothetical protein
METQKECDKLMAEEEINLQKKISAALEEFIKKIDLQAQEIQREVSKKQKDFSDLIFQQLLKMPPSTDLNSGENPQ